MNNRNRLKKGETDDIARDLLGVESADYNDGWWPWIHVNDELPPVGESVFCFHPIYGRYPGFIKEVRPNGPYIWCNWAGESGILPPAFWCRFPDPPKAARAK